jgi:FxsC-like protein
MCMAVPTTLGNPNPNSPAVHGACFFLSYAHTPRVFSDGRDPNYWVREFYRDLCNELVTRDPLWHRGDGPGFMDEAMPDGVIWRHRLADQLARCRIFMPLYSTGYFIRENCGREWSAFRNRQMAHQAQTGLPNEAIVPVLWTKPHREDLPAEAAALQITGFGSTGRYAERGLYELMRLDRDREYVQVIIELAEHLDAVAHSAAPPVGPIVSYDDVRPLFPRIAEPVHPARPAPPTRQSRRLYITIAADDQRSAPAGRERSFYGAHAEDWNPYHPESQVPLAQFAEQVARGLGYTPVTTTLTRASAELRPGAGTNPDGPGIVLIDPWLASDSQRSRHIADLDRRRKPWVRIMIPWSSGDPQTIDRATVLQANLSLSIPWCMEGWLRTAHAAHFNLTTLGEFGDAFPAAVERAWRHYIKAAQPKPPPGTFPPRPRLGGGPPSGHHPDDGGLAFAPPDQS